MIKAGSIETANICAGLAKIWDSLLIHLIPAVDRLFLHFITMKYWQRNKDLSGSLLICMAVILRYEHTDGLLANMYNIYENKAVPLPACRQQGKMRYSFYSFLTSALEGMSGQHHAPAAL
jgi:hypothetical protein